jgi:hypothetical protein
MMRISETLPKSRSPVWSLLSRPRLRSLPRCVHHATAALASTHTPARRSKERIARTSIGILSGLLTLAADLSRGPPAVKSP